jgi:hypothetical protein
MLVNVFPKEKVPKNTTQNNILIYMMYPVSGVIPAKRSIGGKIYYPQKSHYRCNNAIRSMLHVLPIEALHRKILPPYRIIGQICILRQTLTINFSQENMRYLA